MFIRKEVYLSQMEEAKQERIDNLARDVLRLARNTLLVDLRFLDMALSQFTFVPTPGMLATDGQHIFYDGLAMLQVYKAEKERSVRNYLHMVFHCVFRHNFVDTLLNQDCWDLACDMAVESAIADLNISSVAVANQPQQTAILATLKPQVKQLTAEKLYRYYQDQNLSPAELAKLRNLFRADDHRIWYLPPTQQMDTGAADANTKRLRRTLQHGSGHSNTSAMSRAQMAQQWKDIAQRMQTDLETFSQQQGDTAGNLMQNLRAVNRETYDYAGFLRKFAVMGEAMQVNDDEFDYIFYTYGMKLFGNMPLIEPLEYKEVKRIKEFVIAIDTSGSVSGELVQKFVQKTYNILKQEESFFTKINLHIIQCDADIQEDAKITSQEEFDHYLATMTLRGFGGTDFRPVFDYVEQLRQAREFINLKGLIYFTDGFGTFPEQKPDYHTAFVFVNDEYRVPDVPPWAIRLILESTEI